MKITLSVLILLSASLLSAGCASTSNLNERYDVSKRVQSPPLSSHSERSIVVGLVSLKGNYTHLSHEEFLQGLSAGRFRGAATFSPAIPISSVVGKDWAEWREIDMPDRIVVTTQGSNRQVSPHMKRVPVGMAFSIRVAGSDRLVLNILSRVPSWEEISLPPGVRVPELWTVECNGFAIDASRKGWQILNIGRDAIGFRPGTEAVIAYVE